MKSDRREENIPDKRRTTCVGSESDSEEDWVRPKGNITKVMNMEPDSHEDYVQPKRRRTHVGIESDSEEDWVPPKRNVTNVGSESDSEEDWVPPKGNITKADKEDESGPRKRGKLSGQDYEVSAQEVSSLGNQLKSAQGLKRRWTVEEDNILRQAFHTNLAEKTMPPGITIKRIVNKKLTGRTVAQVRTKINNIIHSKQNFR